MNMRRLLISAVLVIPAMPGCQFFLDRRQATPPPLKVAAPPPVRAEDITPSNAADKVRELNDELERDLDGEESR
jgi:hypothetical protein